jgi:uncharacterized surface protein with fasciclin (FAS1) repeats
VPVTSRTSPARAGLALAAAAALALGATACADDLSDAPTTTAAPTTTVAPATTVVPDEMFDIVGTALEATVFTELAGLVVDAGLVDTLRSEGPFTVFAPTDAAFAKIPTATLHQVQDDPKLLATVLTYHVVPGKLTLADLQPGTLTTVAGIDLEVTRKGDTVLINGFEITAGDVMATNGVVHVMSDVLLPPS